MSPPDTDLKLLDRIPHHKAWFKRHKLQSISVLVPRSYASDRPQRTYSLPITKTVDRSQVVLGIGHRS